MSESGYENCWFCPECETTDRKFFDNRTELGVHCDECGTPAQNVGDRIAGLRRMYAEADNCYTHACVHISKLEKALKEITLRPAYAMDIAREALKNARQDRTL